MSIIMSTEKDVRELVIKLSKEAGITIMISSHILGELSKMATCYGVISEGKLVEQFTAEELRGKVRPCIKLTVSDIEKSVSVLKEQLGISDFEIHDNSIKIYEFLDKAAEINSALEGNEVTVQFLSKEEGDYENYFIKLMEGGSVNV